MSHPSSAWGTHVSDRTQRRCLENCVHLKSSPQVEVRLRDSGHWRVRNSLRLFSRISFALALLRFRCNSLFSPMVCVFGGTLETGNAKMEAANQRGASLSLLTRWFAHARPLHCTVCLFRHFVSFLLDFCQFCVRRK